MLRGDGHCLGANFNGIRRFAPSNEGNMAFQVIAGNLFFPVCHRRRRRRFTAPSQLDFGPGNASFGNRLIRPLASNAENPDVQQKRKVIEHICLLKATKQLTEDEEKDMLDYLYTTQYQMRGFLAVSVGRISQNSEDSYTHGVFMRFQAKDDMTMFYSNPFYVKVLQNYVSPYCHEFLNVDFEAEVEDDILPIFRKGEEFNYGVEFVHLFEFEKRAVGARVEEALSSLENLTKEFPSLIVQFTRGANFNHSSKDFTHGTVTRFRSMEAFHMFVGSSDYNEVWNSKFRSITKKSLPLHYIVDPVGKEAM